MNELIEPFRRLIEDACPTDAVRTVEAGGDWRPLWDIFSESGFLDALLPEDVGGAGLSLADTAPLISLIGEHAVPLPIGETMIARALLTRAGLPVPDGPIVLATGAGPTPLANIASHALTGAPDALRLVQLDRQAHPRDLDAAVSGSSAGLRPIAAVLRAALIAGASGRLLEMTVAYANQRTQFGKPIGRQQAVQQQLAVLAEQALMARIASAFGARTNLMPTAFQAAVAKCNASRAATEVATIAHAVHGAIGVSMEHDLQLFTRRLHSWRLADGSEGYWSAIIGELRAEQPADSLLFIAQRSRTLAS